MANAVNRTRSDKRRQILDAAERVFLANGFDGSSLDGIVREAGISKGTIYVYFDGKDDLFRAWCDHVNERVFSSLSCWPRSDESDRDWLVRFGVEFATLMTSDLVVKAARSVIAASDRMPGLAEAFYRGTFQRGLETLLATFDIRGHTFGTDRDVAASMLLELCLGGVYRERLLGLVAAPDIAQRLREHVQWAADLAISEGLR